MNFSMKREQNDARIGSAEHKKFGTMFKAMKYLSTAALLAIVGTAITSCSNDNDLVAGARQSETNTNTVVQTTTVSFADDGASTRALTADGRKTFAVGDQIAVVYWNTSDKLVKATSNPLTASDINNGGKTAKFTVPLTNPKPSTDVSYIYPASMAVDDTSSTGDPDPHPGDFANINYEGIYNSQDGTLATFAANYDLAFSTGKMTAEATLPASIAMNNELALCAFTFKDFDGTDLTGSVSKLVVKYGEKTYTVNRTPATGPIYVAMEDAYLKDITITATTASGSYGRTVYSKFLQRGHLFPITVQMYNMAANATNADKGKLICTDGHIHAYGADADCKADRVAMIFCVGETGETAYTHGLALALKNADDGKWSTSTASTAHSYNNSVYPASFTTAESGLQYNDDTHNSDTYPAFKAAIANNGIAAPTGCSAWFLPTGYQWTLIMHDDLNRDAYSRVLFNGFKSVGGEDMFYNTRYWSATEWDKSTAWLWQWNGTDNAADWIPSEKDIAYNIRPALAF